MELVDIYNFSWSTIKCHCFYNDTEIEISRCRVSSGVNGQAASDEFSISHKFTLNKKLEYNLPTALKKFDSSRGGNDYLLIQYKSIKIKFQKSIQKCEIIRAADRNIKRGDNSGFINPCESDETTLSTNLLTDASKNIMSTTSTTPNSEELILFKIKYVEEISLAPMMSSQKIKIVNLTNETKTSTQSETNVSTNISGAKLTSPSSDETKPSNQSLTSISTTISPNNHAIQSSTTKKTRSKGSEKENPETEHINNDEAYSYDFGTMIKKDSWKITDILFLSFVVVTVSMLFYDIAVRRKISRHLRSSMFRV
ncbi:hypothetical protein RF11_10009 [Thelohanellus kitauei]|uniref:Uncharacterized protein n=1 Tax=Thelohanellus kitauei TaxID=669202 RepID=A0A0C2M392_THEKT|nr:hypothetical protein RF11_10009 [Thelohanellus kitauei]